MTTDKALVLFSGGQDSTVCLAWALARFGHVDTIGFDYRQRHRVELDCRPAILAGLRALDPVWDARLKDDHLLDLGVLGTISDTALTRDVEIEIGRAGLPTSFVPGRNLIFLNFAAALAYRRGMPNLVAGMCETDYSGYPDCRRGTIDALNRALHLGMEQAFDIHTPLMRIDKAGTWALAHRLGGDALIELIVEQTHTCYVGDRETRHEWGYGCGTCPACVLRARGWDNYRAAQATEDHQ